LQASEHHVDGAESRPQHSTGEVNPTENWAEATESSKPIPRPSVSSTSATGQGSSNPAHESEAVSAPHSNEQDSSRPTDDQIIAQENEIRYANAQDMLVYATCVMVRMHTISSFKSTAHKKTKAVKHAVLSQGMRVYASCKLLSWSECIQCPALHLLHTQGLKRSSTMCCCTCRQEAERLPFVGDLEPILALQQGTTWLQLRLAKHVQSQAVICQ